MKGQSLCGLIVVVTILPLLALEEIVESETNFAIQLTGDDFNEAISKNNHFIKFYAPWCGHCKRLHPLWEQLAEMMNVKDDPRVVIAKVDCTQQHELCTQHEITGYPTLRFFKLGQKGSVKFKGTRDMPAITEFINQQLNLEELNEIMDEDSKMESPQTVKGALVELTEDNFAKHVSSGNHFVKFYAPWCSHCQRLAPTWEELAKSLENVDDVSIAKIDCTVYKSICQDFEVKGYPTLLWIDDGKKVEKYSGGRDHDALQTYVKKMLGIDGNKDAATDKEEEIKKEDDKSKVLQLNGDNFETSIAKGITFVKFYAPWCGHCQKLSPTWDKLAEKIRSIKKSVIIAKVDCTAPNNRKLCVDQQVEGYPTLFAYKDGKRQNEYDDSRSLPELLNYVYKLAGHDEL
ncbi:thioredoxin domain-containing protein pretaporter [Glossina fuscipes fuscipes]